MDATMQYDRATVMADMKENQKNIREMVMESYQDMIDGKGRDYKEFFDEMESRYANARI